jgi:hypothetical protein
MRERERERERETEVFRDKVHTVVLKFIATFWRESALI